MNNKNKNVFIPVPHTCLLCKGNMLQVGFA